MLYVRVVKRVVLKNFHHKEKSFFFFPLNSVYEVMDSHNLLWSSFHDVCKSNHDPVTNTVLYVNYISIKLEEKNLHTQRK